MHPARRLWTLFEPYHAVVYFAPETREAFTRAGLKGFWMGYFAGRAAPMGPVPPEVVEETFYNFHHSMVRRAIPDAWSYSSPERVLAARLDGIGSSLRRLLGDLSRSDELRDATEVAGAVAAECGSEDRPLFAAQFAQPVPDDPMLALWHYCTCLREHRGDDHVAALKAYGIDGCEAHVLIIATGTMPAGSVRPHRGWPDGEWQAALDRLSERGLLAEDGGLTKEGRELKEAVEAATDQAAREPWEAVGAEAQARFAAAMTPFVRAIVDGDGVPFPNAIGLVPPDFAAF